MVKNELKNRAINLRKEGSSYSEILKQIPVAKSTLSIWLRSVGFAKPQLQRITKRRIEAQKRGAEAKRNQRLQRTQKITNEACQQVKNLITDPLWLTGVVLYWAEGSKQKEWNPSNGVEFMNMDTAAHQLFIQWCKKYFDSKQEDFQFELYIHESANIHYAITFWANQLQITPENIRFYFKRHNPKAKRKNINANYHGVLKTTIRRSTDLNRKIAGWTKGVIQYLHK